MSRACELLNVKPQTGHYVPVNRSQTGVRSNRRFDPNIQKVSLQSDVLGGKLRLKVAVKTLRTIEHNGGIDKFLINTSNRKLTDRAKQLKKKVLAALPEGELEKLREAKNENARKKPNRSARLEKKLAAKPKASTSAKATADKEAKAAKAAPKKEAAPKKPAASTSAKATTDKKKKETKKED